MKIKDFLLKLVTAINAEITGTPIVELANIATLNGLLQRPVEIR